MLTSKKLILTIGSHRKKITVLEDSFQQKGLLIHVFQRKNKLPNLKKWLHCSSYDSFNISCIKFPAYILFLFLSICIFLKAKATKTYKLKVFILHIRSLPKHTCTCLNTCSSNNFSTLQIQSQLNLCLTKSKQGSPVSPNAALPSSQQVGSGLLSRCDYCCPIPCLSLKAILFLQDDSLAPSPAGSWHPINQLTVLRWLPLLL